MTARHRVRADLRWLMGAAAVGALCAGALGCSPQGTVRAARKGPDELLRGHLVTHRDEQDLSYRELRRVARAYVERELRTDDPEVALARVRQSARCAGHVEGALLRRARQHDAAGAEARMILLDRGLDDPGPMARRHGDDESPYWRAVGARGMVQRRWHDERRALFLDLDELVRRAAVFAAWLEPSEGDRAALSEAARLDPDPLTRERAVRALGRLGGAESVESLAALWEGADESLRLAIVGAWSEPSSLVAGGRARLLDLANQRKSLPSLSAALLLRRDREVSPELLAAILVEFLDRGTVDEQLTALASVSPSDERYAPAFTRALEGNEPLTRRLAAARLLESRGVSDELRAQARGALTEQAAGSDEAAFMARRTLAIHGDAAVLPLLLEQLTGADAPRRAEAGEALLSLGRFSDAAWLLADAEPVIRMRFACSALAHAEGTVSAP